MAGLNGHLVVWGKHVKKATQCSGTQALRVKIATLCPGAWAKRVKMTSQWSGAQALRVKIAILCSGVSRMRLKITKLCWPGLGGLKWPDRVLGIWGKRVKVTTRNSGSQAWRVKNVHTML